MAYNCLEAKCSYIGNQKETNVQAYNHAHKNVDINENISVILHERRM
jgi:hypothetical protein